MPDSKTNPNRKSQTPRASGDNAHGAPTSRKLPPGLIEAALKVVDYRSKLIADRLADRHGS